MLMIIINFNITLIRINIYKKAQVNKKKRTKGASQRV